MLRDDLKRRIAGLESLPTLPGVVIRLFEVTEDEKSDCKDIARIIESDQALTAQVLRLVNSSLFEFVSEITTVSRAAAALGYNAIRCMALGMGVARLFPATGGDGAFQMQEFWKHSVGCAAAAKLIAEKSPKKVDQGEAFVAGLLHDIGKVVLSLFLKGTYDSVVARARETDASLIEVEHEELGVTHTQAGKWLADAWGLPGILAQAVWLHHQPAGSLDEAAFNAPLIFTVQVADILTRQTMVGSSGNDKFAVASEAMLDEIGISESVSSEIQHGLLKHVEDYAAAINLEVDQEELYVESLEKANRALSMLSLKGTEQNRRLRRRERRFEALHQMNGRLRPGQTSGQVIAILADALREGFEVRSGLCSVCDGASRSLRGEVWRDGEAPRDFEIVPGTKTAREGDAGFDSDVRAILVDAVDQFRERVGDAPAALDVLRRQDLLVVPMYAAGRSVGQILLDSRSEQQGRDDDQGMNEILALASAGALAISRARIYQSLEHRSEELATAVWKREEAHKQLLHSERLAAVGKMAAGAAHEINNPLAIISGRAQMILQKEDNADKAKALTLIVDQCVRASKILNDLMKFARPTMPMKDAVGINSVLYEVLGMFEGRFDRHQIELRREFASDLPNVLVDKNQLQQVVVNLLINAEHAIMPPGVITLTSGLSSSRTEVVVTVQDTGCGISPEHLENIFEPFFTTKEEGKGTGLGLSLAHGIITSHRGTIAAKSKVGHGTTFTITLPVAVHVSEAKEKSAAASAKPEKTGTASKRILVVDDEEHVRAVISDAFADAGYVVEQAENGLVALEATQRTPHDLITLDVRMPRMDGMSVLRALREHGPHVPIIVVTGLASEEETDAAMELGVFACIRKPFRVEELLEEAKKALSGKPRVLRGGKQQPPRRNGASSTGA